MISKVGRLAAHPDSRLFINKLTGCFTQHSKPKLNKSHAELAQGVKISQDGLLLAKLIITSLF